MRARAGIVRLKLQPFYERLGVLEYHQFPRVSQAAVNRYFNLIGVSLTTAGEELK
jgi:hypothetical protein